MSSRVGTAIPANPSTAWSSAAVGLNMSIQTALSGRAPAESIFLSDESEGTNTENMESSRTGREIQQQDLARFGQELHGGAGAPPRICGSPTAGTRLASPKLHPAAQK